MLAQRQRTTEMQERFTAILGHDLRNPLSSVTMGIRLLRKCPPTQQATLDRMASSSARMSRMIDQLLDLTRSRLGGGISLACAPMNLGKLVTQVADEARAAHPERAPVLEMKGDLDGEWDPDRLAQVISNLVGNAIDHGAPGSPVHILVEGLTNEAQVTVHNAGPPIPETLQQVLFDPFRRGQSTGESSHSSGLGLGLYIAREIVRAHGGAIDVASGSEGTMFRVVLPRARDVVGSASRGASPR